MKVKDLIEELSYQDPEDEVIIIPKCHMAGAPQVSITGAMNGFDWYNGKCILGVSHDVYATFPEEMSEDTEWQVLVFGSIITRYRKGKVGYLVVGDRWDRQEHKWVSTALAMKLKMDEIPDAEYYITGNGLPDGLE